MPAATFFIASLAALEPPRRPPATFYQTVWSLSAAPRALAAAQPQDAIFGPGQTSQAVSAPIAPALPVRKREVTIVPIPDEPDYFENLADPEAPAEATADADTAAAEAAVPEPSIDAAAAASDPLGDDPFADEFSKQLKPAFDPFEELNRISFSVSQFIDRIAIRPLALTYYKISPKPIRDGMRNVLSHWGAPVTIANDLLQLKPKRALKTAARFLINTLLGLGGIFDVAKEKKFNLPFHGNSFSNTLAFYGVKQGPYFYMPILGPTTLLDQVNRVHGYIPGIDYPLFRNGRGTVFQYLLGLEDRATNDDGLKALLDDAVDPYASFRETWLQERNGEIMRLKAPDGVEPNSYEANPISGLDPLVDPAAPDEVEPNSYEANPIGGLDPLVDPAAPAAPAADTPADPEPTPADPEPVPTPAP